MKKFIMIVIVLALAATTSIYATDVGEKIDKVQQTAQIQMPGCTVVAFSSEVTNIEAIGKSEPNSQSALYFAGIGGAEKVNLSSITKTENYAGSLVKSDVANMSVVDTGKSTNATVSMTTKDWMNETNLVANLPPSNEFAFSDTGQKRFNVNVSNMKMNYGRMNCPYLDDTLMGEVLLCYTGFANNNTSSNTMVESANYITSQTIENIELV